MDNLRILLCCGAGMSSGFLASSARKAAKKAKMAVTVEARSHAEVADMLPAIDVLMLAPHYADEYDKYAAIAEPFGVKVALIPADVYASLNGAKLLEVAQAAAK